MWEGMASGHTPNYKRNKLTKSPQQPTDNRLFSESLSPATSQHLVEAGLASGGVAAASSPPTRRLSAGSSAAAAAAAAAAGKGAVAAAVAAASHRISVRRLNARSRLGRTPPLVLSKAVQSLQMVRDDLAKLASSSCPIKPVNTISTQTLEQDELSGSATSMIAKRHSRIPVRQDRIRRDRERGAGQKEDPSGAVRVAEELFTSYSKCNVFSVVNISVSASKLQTIDSTSKLSVAIKPSVEKQEFCTVSQASVLACPEFKFKTVDVDTTLENWKPNRAELSIVTEPKTEKQKTKVNSKTGKSKSKNKGCWKKSKSRETVGGESTLSASNSDKTSAVDSSDKEKSSGKSSNRRRESSSRSKTDAKSSANSDAGGCRSEGITCSGTTSGSNCRVHFSPQLTSSCSPTKAVDEGGKTESVSDKDFTGSVSKLPDIIKRVTDQAITSIAKSVMLGLPRQPPSSDTHQATHPTTSDRHSSTLLPNSGSFQLSRQPPLTMSSVSINDDSYAVHRRNPSQLSVSSLLSSHTPYSPKASSRYKSYRSSAPPLSKTRKDFDNRHSQTWKLPVDAWYNDTTIDSSEYLDDSRRYQSTSDRAALSFTRSHNWTRPHSRKRTHRATMPDVTASSWAMPSSSSSLYLPEQPMKYSRPSQRFSVKGSGGGGLLLSSTRSSRISRLDEHDLGRSSRSPMSSYHHHHHSGFYGSSTPRRLHLRT